MVAVVVVAVAAVVCGRMVIKHVVVMQRYYFDYHML
jgi:hypothetical protein